LPSRNEQLPPFEPSLFAHRVPHLWIQSELSEIRAVERTRLPKEGRVPATRGGTVPITTYRPPPGTSGRASPRGKVSPSTSGTGAQEGHTAPQGTGKAWAAREQPRVSTAQGRLTPGTARGKGKGAMLSSGRHRAPPPPNTRFPRFNRLQRPGCGPSLLTASTVTGAGPAGRVCRPPIGSALGTNRRVIPRQDSIREPGRRITPASGGSGDPGWWVLGLGRQGLDDRGSIYVHQGPPLRLGRLRRPRSVQASRLAGRGEVW